MRCGPAGMSHAGLLSELSAINEATPDKDPTHENAEERIKKEYGPVGRGIRGVGWGEVAWIARGESPTRSPQPHKLCTVLKKILPGLRSGSITLSK